LQVELAEKINFRIEDYTLFLCSSEANENALKLASFHNNKSRILLLTILHGRTSAAVALQITKIVAPINAQQIVTFYH
jgi:acetylornithine aminotransferase